MATALGILVVPLSIWFYSVSRTVTEPYLDEVFHVRQAQEYCVGHWNVWDPKVTTPPGLYVLSVFLSSVRRYLVSLLDLAGVSTLESWGCDITSLRAVNAIGLVVLVFLSQRLYADRNWEAYARAPLLFAGRSSLNIALFPPLFFFSALYYTDMWSTVLVLLSYQSVISSNAKSPARLMLGPFVCGLLSLLFRQTNIFWVAIFPAALILLQHVDRGHQAVRDSMHRRVEGFGDSFYSVIRTTWKMEVVYDVPIRDAWLEDYIKTALSLAAAAAKLLFSATQPPGRKRILNLLTALAPYLVLLAIFTAFLLINGSVVLGDKSNHVATLHLPQLLYLWPFMTFFSWPLLAPYLALPAITVLANVTTLEALQIFHRRRRLLPRVWVVVLFALLAGAVVWANTIVHPFTLADNRHYTFYVFRRLLLRTWWSRYAVIPIYILCGWACIQALGGGQSKHVSVIKHDDGSGAAETGNRGRKELPVPDSEHGARTSFLLIWLATTALQLVTAPLVEPRYFILPWIFWRLHLPLRVPKQGESLDWRLWAETAWLLAVNAATGYTFLHSGFEWPGQPGEVQRFMW